MAIKKITDEKKEIVVQLEEANKKCSVLEQKLSDLKNKVEDTEKSMKSLNEESNDKLKENTNIIEGETVIPKSIFLWFLVDK